MNKKKQVNDLNTEYAILRLAFLEEEALRHKKEKDTLLTKDINQLRAEIEKLLAENLSLKKYISDLNFEFEQKEKHNKEQVLSLNIEK